MRAFRRFLPLVHMPSPPPRKDAGPFHFQGTCHVIGQTNHPTTGIGCLLCARNCSVQDRRCGQRRLGVHRENIADGDV